MSGRRQNKNCCPNFWTNPNTNYPSKNYFLKNMSWTNCESKTSYCPNKNFCRTKTNCFCLKMMTNHCERRSTKTNFSTKNCHYCTNFCHLMMIRCRNTNFCHLMKSCYERRSMKRNLYPMKKHDR